MAHFAEIDENNIVTRVIVTDNDHPDGDEGHSEITRELGGRWLKTSYTSISGRKRNPNTGEFIDGAEHFRYNYAGVGFTYDEELDAFIPPKQFDSWVLDEAKCIWMPPTPMPENRGPFMWDEESLSWIRPPMYSSWIEDEDGVLMPPTSMPNNGNIYVWDFSINGWSDTGTKIE